MSPRKQTRTTQIWMSIFRRSARFCWFSEKEIDMTLVEEDLLAASKELYATSKIMTSGERTTGEEMNRYY